jgi:hypothetical protein
MRTLEDNFRATLQYLQRQDSHYLRRLP